MNFILNHSQYKHECDIEQQKEDIQIYSSSTKIYDRHQDNSLLGSVRRRFITQKIRAQNSSTPPPPPPSTPIVVSTSSSSSSNNTNGSRSKIRSMTMDIKRSTSRESMITNGKMISIFSLSKVNYLFLDLFL